MNVDEHSCNCLHDKDKKKLVSVIPKSSLMCLCDRFISLPFAMAITDLIFAIVV